MTGYLWAALAILAAVAMTAFRGMASEELRDRLDHLPHTILRVAARRLSPAQRTTIYDDEWVPELTYILKDAEARPITRLITGTRYALGILVSAPRIARHLHREPEKLPSNGRRPLTGASTSENLAWGQLTPAGQAQLLEARLRDYTHVEEGTGRRYRRTDLTAMKSGSDRLDFEWRGVRPSNGRRWAYSKENLDRMHAEGRIEFSKSGRPVRKRYLDEQPGAPLRNV